MNPFCERLGLAHPIIQAPMAGVSTPALAVAVSEAGALGSLAAAALPQPEALAQPLAALAAATGRSMLICSVMSPAQPTWRRMPSG
jgi:nitronate monooxygenase